MATKENSRPFRASNLQTPSIPQIKTRPRNVSLSAQSDMSDSSTSNPRSSIDSTRSEIFDIIEFPYQIVDYSMNKIKPLGSGLWSNVYSAKPIPPQKSSLTTPPSGPQFRNILALAQGSKAPSLAIKSPANQSAHAVLRHEADVLSHLSSSSNNFIVPFFGLDSRNSAIVMEAMPLSLEKFVTDHLGALDEKTRARHLEVILPQLILDLVQGLKWMHSKGVVHADIKPGNILLKPSHVDQEGIQLYTPYLADFSSAQLSHSATSPDSSTPLGGGTWDYLCPSLLRPPFPSPSPATDVYALAVSILYVIIGASPFSSAPSNNQLMKREMIKQGRALQFATESSLTARRRTQAFSSPTVSALLVPALVKSVNERVDAEHWHIELKKLFR